MSRTGRSTTYGLTIALLFAVPGASPAQDALLPPANPLPESTEPTPTALPSPPALAADTPPSNTVPPPDLSSPPVIGPSAWINPHVGHAPLLVDYRGAWFPEEPVAGQATNLGYVEQDLSIAMPTWQQAPDEWTANLHARSEFFQTQATLPGVGRAFPDGLYNIGVGTTYRHLFDNGWIAGGGVSVGSASDLPFHSIDEMTAGVNAFLRIPSNEHDAWLFTLVYSPTSELPFPIPGVAYVWQPSPQFRMQIGLPFQIQYRPTDELIFDLSYMLLRTVHARATYRMLRQLRLHVGYDWGSEGYFLADRPDVNDRLYYYDMRTEAGVEYLFSPHFSLGVEAGYVFDRFYFIGQRYGDRIGKELQVGNGPFLMGHGMVRW